MLRDELIYGIWLQKCLGVNNKRLHKALEMFETPEELYRASERDIRLVGFFSDHEIINLINKNTERCEKVLSDCESLGIKAVCIGQPEYPEMLSEIATPPIMLYIKGNMPAQNRFHAAVVGTRYPADSSKRLAFSFGYDLAKASAVVVSGGAIGIDSFAHRGAVESGGSSIMVLGCGIDCFHSISTESFIDKLVINGALVSEYPPGVSPEKYHFPMRNRIITGLSHCCAVVQAGIGSGAMIAARCAVSQRRTLFAVPGTVENPKFAGSNLLLRNGFKAVLCADDILRWYQYSHGKYAEAIDIENNPSLKMELTGKFEPALGEIQSDGKRSIKQPPGYILCTMVENISHGGKITDISDYLCRNELTNPETQRIVSFSESDSDEEQYDSEPSLAEILSVPEKQELSAVNEIPEPDAEPEGADIHEVSKSIPFEENKDDNEALMDESPDDSPASSENNQQDENAQKIEDGVKKEIIQELIYDMIFKGKSQQSVSSQLFEILGKKSGIADYSGDYGGNSPDERYFSSKEADDISKLQRLYNKLGINWGVMNFDDIKFEADHNNTDVPAKEVNTAEKIYIKNDEESGEKSEETSKNRRSLSDDAVGQLTGNAVAVYHTVSDTPVHVDAIMLKTGLRISEVLSAVTELQMEGLVRRLPGSRYIRK